MYLLADLNPAWDADIYRDRPGAFADHFAFEFRLHERPIGQRQVEFLMLRKQSFERIWCNSRSRAPKTLGHPNPADPIYLVIYRLSSSLLKNL